MELKAQIEVRGKLFNVIYRDGLPEQPTDVKMLDGVHSYCFCGDKLVVVSKDGQYWTPPGGAIEKAQGESFEEASIREVKEESNMKVLHQECIGYQDWERVEDGWMGRQFRMFCIVEPYGEFVSDPDGDIFHVKLIDPKDYKEYIKWNEIGDRLMERALEMKKGWSAEWE